MSQTLLVLDTPTLYYRAFYALPDSIRTPDGEPIAAVRGVLDTIAQLAESFGTRRIIATMDADWRPDFRVALLPEYKAHRVTDDERGTETPEDLEPQIPRLVEALTALGVVVAEVPGTEADDVIASICAQVPGEETVVVSSDRDLLSLLSPGDGLRIHRPLPKGAWETTMCEDLPELYGVSTGAEYRALAALRGDPSDGIPGVPGIGEKTAAKLIAGYGGLDAVLSAASAGGRSHGLSPKRSEAIRSASDAVRAGYAVMEAKTGLDVSAFVSAAGSAGDAAAARDVGRRYGVARSVDRVLEAFAGTGGAGTAGAGDAGAGDAGSARGTETAEGAHLDVRGSDDLDSPAAPEDGPADSVQAAIPGLDADPAPVQSQRREGAAPAGRRDEGQSTAPQRGETASAAHGAGADGGGTVPWSARIHAFDTETTGVDVHGSRIVTAALVTLEDGVEVSRREWLIDPGVEIPAAAQDVHGISTAYARAHGVRPAEALAEIGAEFAQIAAAGEAVVGHNVVFDLTILRAELSRHISAAAAADWRASLPAIVDTLVLDKHVEKYRRGSRILTNVAERWGASQAAAHDAGDDARTAGLIACAIAAAYPEIAQMSAAALHDAQAQWKAEQAADLQAYLRRRNPQATVSPEWPLES